MFGIPLPQLGIIAVMAVIALSMVPASVWASLKPKISIPESPDNSKPVDTSNKYLAVQKMLLDARTACGECPEAITAIDAAIRATVAMVCKSKPSYSVTSIGTYEPFPPVVSAVAPEVKQ